MRQPNRDDYMGWLMAIADASAAEANVMKAAMGAVIAYAKIGTIDAAMVFQPDFAGQAKTAAAFRAAAAFLRDYPEASAEAVTIHLQRAGFLNVPRPDRRGLAAWKVFAFTLHQLDAVDAQEAAERAAAEAKPAPAGGLPLDQAFKPEPGAFDPTGFMPR